MENPSQARVWKLLMVNALSCGVEACMAAGTVYIPPLLLQAGMEERYMTMVLAMSPVLGLIFIPMIGSASDSWRGHFGRRRPFIWMLSLGVLLGLQVIPQAWRLTVLMSPQHPQWLEAVLQAGGVCLMDFCGQACLTLLAAMLSDLFPAEEENHRAFSVYSLMTSLGGCLGFFLPAMDWSQVPIATYLGGQEAFVYALLTFLFLSCLFTTAFIPEETGTRGGEGKTVARSPLRSWSSRYCPHSFLLRPQRYLVALGRCASACMSVFPRVYTTCVRVPAVIWRLFVAEMCSWMALMSVMLFFADFMGEALYQGVPSAKPQSQEREHYDEGVRMASLGLFLQCVVSVLCSVLMDRWVALLGVRVVYISGVALLVFATIVLSVSESVITVTAMAAVTGYTLSVLQVLPYTLLCLYHSDIQAFFTSSKPRPPQLNKNVAVAVRTEPLISLGPATPHAQGHTGGLSSPGAEPAVGSPHVLLFVAGGDTGDTDCTPFSQRGMCFDMAILDSAYLLSQVLPAMCLGSIVQLTNSVRAYMASACCFSLLALLCSTRVVYSHADLQR
ncbi:solute carrier family 45 member 3 [Dicentrarchus labrax]|uniref:Solute carrier family 45 member 3 n=1 Tax=Dicentrarchus labrax TaxID=13489 RepID=A0A8C4EAK0_DICLA|nr:solute carrier family 45 member 3 [Dicentrarchus labrax]XP_051272442.1 solute carrier family 45 member 3 [Dicentrarchus labrax]